MYPEVETEDMQMPCRCKCGKWFDLHDGFSLFYSNDISCEDCADKDQKEADRMEDIQDALELYNNGILDLRNARERLAKAGYDLTLLDTP